MATRPRSRRPDPRAGATTPKPERCTATLPDGRRCLFDTGHDLTWGTAHTVIDQRARIDWHTGCEPVFHEIGPGIRCAICREWFVAPPTGSPKYCGQKCRKTASKIANNAHKQRQKQDAQ